MAVVIILVTQAIIVVSEIYGISKLEFENFLLKAEVDALEKELTSEKVLRQRLDNKYSKYDKEREIK